MKTTYFLFGKEASNSFMDEGLDSFIHSLEEGEFEFELYEANSDTNPADLLYSFQKWGDYCILSYDEFSRVRQVVEV